MRGGGPGAGHGRRAFLLTPEDHIFGSHRSHGEILAKAFPRSAGSATGRCSHIMENPIAMARCFARIEKKLQGVGEGLSTAVFHLRSVQRDFCARDWVQPWFGRLHARLLCSFWHLPKQRYCGGSGSIAPGAALFKRVNRKPGIVVANIGDASFGCGPVVGKVSPFLPWTNTAPSGTKALAAALPIIFNCMNNFYGMGGQPLGNHGRSVHCAHRRGGQPRTRCTPSA